MSQLIKVVAVSPLGEHWLRLDFSDGAAIEVDVGPLLRRGGVFQRINEHREVFEAVRVNAESGTVEWPGGVDLDAEVLYGREESASGIGLTRRVLHNPRSDLLRVASELPRLNADREVTPTELANALNAAEHQVEANLETLRAWGLALGHPEEGVPYAISDAGVQFIEREGLVDHHVLRFLPHYIDDLHAREALLDAGTIVVDEFRYAVLHGGGVEHARDLVPPAFRQAVSEAIALNLFAAAVALMARLSSEEPAGCVAEEIIAVALIHEAEAVLELAVEEERFSHDEGERAKGELKGLFELFQDDDVLNLFEMVEPADAAVAERSWVNVQLGVVDQRLDAWFVPFGWTPPTGYLSERGPVAELLDEPTTPALEIAKQAPAQSGARSRAAG